MRFSKSVRRGRHYTVLLAAMLITAMAEPVAEAQSSSPTHWVYFGTGAAHIYVASFDEQSGALGAAREAAEIGRPGFLAVHPSRDVVYAVGREEAVGGGMRGVAQAFAIDRRTGDLRAMNSGDTAGNGAAHVAVNPSATLLAAVNYGDGNTVTLTLERDGRVGSLVADIPHSGSSVHPSRQTKPHPHSANFSPDGDVLIVPDLGTDELVSYEVGERSLTRRPDPQTRMAAGSGPRHMTFHPNGRWAYVINELASTVTVLDYDGETGTLESIQTVPTLPSDYDGAANTTAEVLVHPNGRFLYGSNRGSNTLAAFSIDDGSGRLTPLGRTSTGGDWPRNFRLSPEGSFLLVANQRSNDVRVFRINSETGALTDTEQAIPVPNPMCVRFVPVG